MINKLIWFFTRRNTHCTSFCLFCKYYEICKADVEYIEEMEGKE